MMYLDASATSQKPQIVLDAMNDFYTTSNANVHRGMHVLSERATTEYEKARESVRRFLNASSTDEIIFTKSSTESINLVARCYGEHFLKEGDAVLVSILEHHSNIVPWLQLKEKKGIDVRWIEVDQQGQIRMDSFESQLAEKKVKMVAITGLSNVLGTLPPLKEMIASAHKAGALVIVDAAQLAAHAQIDVQDLDCDFLAFSGHKIYGPTGIGVLYGKKDLLGAMPPFLGGGMMIKEVTRGHFVATDLPAKFEAGTPPIAEAVGLRTAIEWQKTFSWKDRQDHEREMLALALSELKKIEGLHILGPKNPDQILGCISFVVDGVHPHDLTDILGSQGICLRAGHHCAQPLHDTLGIPASTRLSISLHTTKDDILILTPAITKAIKILKK